MAVRSSFTAGEVLTAADLTDTFAAKLPYAFGTATPSTTTSGFLWYDSNSTPAAPKFWTGSAFQALTSGKILQVVRATDGTARTTTSTTFVDASLSITITPQKNDSAILLLGIFQVSGPADNYLRMQITDNSNNAISGAQDVGAGGIQPSNQFKTLLTMVGYATPATTSAVTYKSRFRGTFAGTQTLENNVTTAQMYAIEVSA